MRGSKIAKFVLIIFAVVSIGFLKGENNKLKENFSELEVVSIDNFIGFVSLRIIDQEKLLLVNIEAVIELLDVLEKNIENTSESMGDVFDLLVKRIQRVIPENPHKVTGEEYLAGSQDQKVMIIERVRAAFVSLYKDTQNNIEDISKGEAKTLIKKGMKEMREDNKI